MKMRKAIPIAVAVVVALAALPAHALYYSAYPDVFIEGSYLGERTDAALWTWSHTDVSRETGDLLSSSVAHLAQMGPDIWDLRLTNASPGPTSAPADILQGMFWTLNDGYEGVIEPWGETPVALNGSEIIGPDPDEDKLRGWAFRNDLATGDANPFNAVYGVTHGIGNPGLGDQFGRSTFGPSNTFATWLGEDDDQWPSHDRAGSYGIVAEDTVLGSPLVGTYVSNSLTFRFSAPEFNPDDHIDRVVFHYGTDANIIPEPATMTLLGLGLAGLGARHVRRRSKRG